MEDEKLIEFVRKSPVLYDMTIKTHTNSDVKKKVWIDIARKMKSTPSACKARWCNIRDNYRKSLKKNKTISGQGGVVKDYKYADLLIFMKPFYEERATVSNVQLQCTEDIAELESSNETYAPNSCNVDEYPTPSKSKFQLRQEEEPSQSAAAAVMNYFLERQREEHPVDLFTKYISASLKTFPPQQLHAAKRKIFNIVAEMESDLLKSDS